ncbi:MAG: alpha-ribazole phosphatase [Bacillota bacterium]|nr:alpha-ribazole phosphatase [Bacillota bacterium]
MIELILIRHGETDTNNEQRYSGWTDSALNLRGVEQAYELKEKLKDIKITYIFSSPLIRAVRTSEIINEAHGLNINYVDDLKERNFGVFENMTYDEICQIYPYEKDEWNKNWNGYVIDKGESADSFFQRVNIFVKNLIEDTDSGVYVLVTHSGCIRSIAAYLLGMGHDGFWKFKIENCKIMKFHIKDCFATLTCLNC